MAKQSLSLHVPEYKELWYRQKILGDPETMRYNAGYNLGFDGYDNMTGCIDFPETDWEKWYNYFIGCEPYRYYAYIVNTDGEFVGEVNLHMSDESNVFDMGIVLEAKRRGKGYAVEALKMLLKQAFEKMNADAVCNEFEDERLSAVKIHLDAGFEAVEKKNGITVYKITKQKYFAK